MKLAIKAVAASCAALCAASAWAQPGVLSQVRSPSRSATLAQSSENGSTSYVITYKENGATTQLTDADIYVNCSDVCMVARVSDEQAAPFKSQEGLLIVANAAHQKVWKTGDLRFFEATNKRRFAQIGEKIAKMSFDPDEANKGSGVSVSWNFAGGFGGPKQFFAGAQDPENPIVQDPSTLPGAWITSSPKNISSFLRIGVPIKEGKGGDVGVSIGYGATFAGYRNKNASFDGKTIGDDGTAWSYSTDVNEKRKGLLLNEIARFDYGTPSVLGGRVSARVGAGLFFGRNDERLVRTDSTHWEACITKSSTGECLETTNQDTTDTNTWGENHWSGAGASVFIQPRLALSSTVSVFYEWERFWANTAVNVHKFGVEFQLKKHSN